MDRLLFHIDDTKVHRGRNYVSTLKMYSSRTKNTECLNLANVSLELLFDDGAK